jgi:hypothetical protein
MEGRGLRSFLGKHSGVTPDRGTFVKRSGPWLGVIVALLVAGTAVGSGAAASRKASAIAVEHMTYYALVDKESYVNNQDDRARGEGTNPFGTAQGTGIATTNERGKGPLPGDEGLYELKLYPNAQLTKPGPTANFVCQYAFLKVGSCDVSFRLDDGTIVGTTVFDAFERKQFSVIVTGGTARYVNARGSVDVTSANVGNAITGKLKVTHNVPVLLLQPVRLSFALHSSAAVSSSQTMYSVAKTEQFIDNGDDEVRGWIRNPFAMRDLAQESLENHGASPLPGDESLFSLALYSGADQKASTGTATLTCEYAFSRNAFCDETYQLKGGTVLAAGPVGFDGKTFSLAIVGGSGKYEQATGDLTSTEGPNSTQRVALSLG